MKDNWCHELAKADDLPAVFSTLYVRCAAGAEPVETLQKIVREAFPASEAEPASDASGLRTLRDKLCSLNQVDDSAWEDHADIEATGTDWLPRLAATLIVASGQDAPRMLASAALCHAAKASRDTACAIAYAFREAVWLAQPVLLVSNLVATAQRDTSLLYAQLFATNLATRAPCELARTFVLDEGCPLVALLAFGVALTSSDALGESLHDMTFHLANECIAVGAWSCAAAILQNLLRNERLYALEEDDEAEGEDAQPDRENELQHALPAVESAKHAVKGLEQSVLTHGLVDAKCGASVRRALGIYDSAKTGLTLAEELLSILSREEMQGHCNLQPLLQLLIERGFVGGSVDDHSWIMQQREQLHDLTHDRRREDVRCDARAVSTHSSLARGGRAPTLPLPPPYKTRPPPLLLRTRAPTRPHSLTHTRRSHTRSPRRPLPHRRARTYATDRARTRRPPRAPRTCVQAAMTEGAAHSIWPPRVDGSQTAFEITVVMPSGAALLVRDNLASDSVGNLAAKLSEHPELSAHDFYMMHHSSCLNERLALCDYNIQARSELRALHCAALPGGVGDTNVYAAKHQQAIEAALSAAVTDVMWEQPPDPVRTLAQRLAYHGDVRREPGLNRPANDAAPATAVSATPAATDEPGSPARVALLPCLQLKGHVKARGQDNPLYPPRHPVPDELAPWDVPFPDYAPEAWTHVDVLANDRELSTGAKWADPPDVARLGQRVSYAGDGLPKPLVLGADGKPRNPVGRTGLRDRGLLGKWGPNHAADPIVTRYHPETGKLQMVAIRREDTGQWAIPGGMVDDGKVVPAKLRREFTEEAGNLADGDARVEFDAQVTFGSLLRFDPAWHCADCMTSETNHLP